MSEPKRKKCRGTGKAIGHGCGCLSDVRILGLCQKCYQWWLYNTNEGKKRVNRFTVKARKDREKDEKQKTKEEKINVQVGNQMMLADKYFSQYVRLFHSEDGYCTCYTCGVIKPIKEVDNGHFVKRAHKKTRYEEDNCRPQCKTCNGDIKHNGRQVEFRKNLVVELGEARVEEIERAEKENFKMSGRDMKNIADEYREKVKQLQKDRGVKHW